MGWITAKELQFQYQWTAMGDDDPRKTGKPDSVLLNRNEGYEVLYFLNHISADKAGALKGERMIRNHLPPNVRSREHILKWLIDNWSKFA